MDATLRSAYVKLRHREISDEVQLSALVDLGLRKTVEMVRGNLRGRIYLSLTTSHFRGKGVQIIGQSRFKVGNGVSLDDYCRIDANSTDGVTFGDRVTVGRFALVSASGVIAEPGVGIQIGSNTSIGASNIIWGQGGVKIGRDCLLGPNVVIVSENHGHSDLESPIRIQQPIRSQIVIEDDCWIGANVTVLAGVRIGKGSIVGAGSVVNSDVPPQSIVGGVPAKLIRSRSLV
ncbi:acyltransferase [Arthrobacter glacialis]|nr:acyltransferase [Arthrobacter glacialis]